MNWLFDQFGEWLQSFYTSLFEGIANDVVDLSLSIVNSFWQDDLITTFQNLSLTINLTLAVLSIILVLVDLAEESKPILWAQVFGNLLKGVIFAGFSRFIGQSTMLASNLIVENLHISFDASALVSVINSLPGTFIGHTIIWCLVIIVAFVAFFVMCLIRNASMFILMFSSALYIPDIMRGDTAKIGDWIRQVVAVSFTFVFQYIMFNIGISGMVAGDASGYIQCLTGFVGMFVAPKLLERYGYSSGVAGIASNVGNMAVQAGHLFPK